MADITPPDAARHPHTVTAPFGAERNDPYYWMRDDERKNPDIIDYLNAENHYADEVLAPLASFRKTLYDEIVGRIQPDDTSVPTLRNGYWYYNRVVNGKDYPITARRKASDDVDALTVMWANNAGDFAAEEILLDLNKRAEGKDFYRAGSIVVSPDTQLLAWTEDDVGRNQFHLHVKEIASGKEWPETITGVSSNLVWANDNQTLLYIENDPSTLLTTRVKKHRLGTEATDDILLYEEEDHSFYLHLYRTRDDRFINLVNHSTDTIDIKVTSADTPEEFSSLTPRESGLRYFADHFDKKWFITTNANDAENFKIVTAATNSRSRNQWETLLPYDPDIKIENIELFDQALVISERSNALERIRIILKDGQQYYVPTQEAVYSMWPSGNTEAHTDWLRYNYTSLTSPNTVYEINLKTKEQRKLKQQSVAGYNPEEYLTERVWVDARDGTSVPVSLVYRKDLEKNGSAPLYQYAYGSYGASMDPTFSASIVSLLDRGVVFAMAHVRGGEELGRHWYDQGRLLNKQNTFNDFVDVTRALVQQGYADPKRVAAMGGSAGGLLMGAIANQAPEEYRVIEAHVPFVDVVTTMLDPSIPLTTNEYDEWGNPEVETFYDYILSYSPYDNVKAQAYPAMYITTGLWDSQVQYWEPMKWVARLRDDNTGDQPIVFRVNMEAGHGGKSGRYKRYEEQAESYAFVLDQLGVSEKG